MQNLIISVMGKKGTGKSTHTKNLIYEKFGDKHTKRVLVFDTLLEYDFPTLTSFDDFKSGIKRIKPNEFNIEASELFEIICNKVYKYGNMLFVVDEVDLFCSANYTPNSLQKIFRYGRHYEIDVIIVTRRPAAIPRHLTAMVDEFHIFKSHEQRDIKYYNDLSDSLGDRVKMLKQYDFINFKP